MTFIGYRVINWNTLWYHTISPANVLTAWFGKQTFSCDRFHMHCGIDKFWFTCRKLITTTELQYYVNLRANFHINKIENLSVQFEKQSIITIHSFFSVMAWKRPSNHFQSSDCFIYVEIGVFLLNSCNRLLPRKC